MKLGKRYIVTKASDDGTFELGDHISLCKDGAIACVEAQGWIEKEDLLLATKGMEVEIDLAWIEQRRDRLLAELTDLEC